MPFILIDKAYTRMIFLLIFWLCLFVPGQLFAQHTAVIRGRVTSSINKPVFSAGITIPGTSTGTVTGKQGYYELRVPANEEITLHVSCLGYESRDLDLQLEGGTTRELNIQLEVSYQDLEEVEIRSAEDRTTTLSRINIKSIRVLPNPSSSIEDLIKTLPGVSSSNELSTQYRVRGGNFDENLVYVNDVEIYRPFLIRSGQQEGLSFVNSDMVSSIEFSAGGFESLYGDKMSSVLDIKYRKPHNFSGSASMSLLGGSLHLEDAPGDQRFTYSTGIRYKTTQYLLSSLETKGEYRPRFLDVQTYMTYQLTPSTEISFLGNISRNSYEFIPETRSTEFGTFRDPLNLVIYYDGQENDNFNIYQGALSALIRPRQDLSLKFIASAFNTRENESFDIQGQYLLNELDNTANSETYGDSILNLGIGTFLNHARNELNAYVWSFSHLGYADAGINKIRWGIRYKHERIFDEISEWEMIDSAGYSLPWSDEAVNLSKIIKSNNNLVSNRLTAYLQDRIEFGPDSLRFFLNLGLRASYWDMNGEFLLSPRATLSMVPKWNRDLVFRLSAGLYYQPPFYKELRYPNGSLNRDIKAQRSIHYVLGGDYVFTAWNRPFKLTAEIFHKSLSDLIPYKVDNVRVEYSAENMASGYATGMDLKLNGQFVPGAESWVSIGLLKTMEDIEGDYYINDEGVRVEPDAYPRPTDQLLNFGLFFQDYFPNNPSYKVHLTFLYGSRMPVTNPLNDRYDQKFRMPSYKRVDIGFSKVLKSKEKSLPEGNPFRHFESIWLSGEIFNLLGVENTISYLWVKTVYNQQNLPGQFAVPNYLTSRRFNIKLTAEF